MSIGEEERANALWEAGKALEIPDVGPMPSEIKPLRKSQQEEEIFALRSPVAVATPARFASLARTNTNNTGNNAKYSKFKPPIDPRRELFNKPPRVKSSPAKVRREEMFNKPRLDRVRSAVN
mmetsp:Transcript_28631/g.50412  ORF Transcript_28631/g.50412 Transcript_28631/m.50412 type:complete len:122 (+) Transcript_28631:121-486(+)